MSHPSLRRRLRRVVRGVIAVALTYLVAAYAVMPVLLRHYGHNPALADEPKTTVTAQGLPSDPRNVGLVGEESEAVSAMLALGWGPADPITLKSRATALHMHRYLAGPVVDNTASHC